MKKNHIILLGSAALIMAVKLSAIAKGESLFGIPKVLQILNIFVIVMLFASLALISSKPKLSKIFTVLLLVSGYIESGWKYSLNEMSIPYLVFLVVGYSFFGFILWGTATGEIESKEGTI